MKTLLITGAATGIGLETLKLALSKGYTVLAVTHTEEQAKNLPANTPYLAGDLTEASFREQVLEKFGEQTDVLILNAGHGESGPLIEQPEERIRKVFEINVFSTLLLARMFAHKMAEKGAGRLIFVTSIAGFITLPNLGAYAASKHAMEAMSDALRLELAPLGIHVSSVEPGMIYTGFNEKMAATKFEWLKEDSLFKKDFPAWKKQITKLPEISYPPRVVAKTLLHVATTKRPKGHNPTPWNYGLMNTLLHLLPLRWQDRILKKVGN